MADPKKPLFPTDGSVYVREATPLGWQPDGSYAFFSRTTPKRQPSISVGFLPPLTEVPVIFVPGIMGNQGATQLLKSTLKGGFNIDMSAASV